MCSVISSLSDKIQRRTIQFFSVSCCSSGFLTSTGHLSITEDQQVKNKVLKIESSEQHWTTKQARAIQVWIRRIVWSSSEVKTCASGIWLCREEDSWPTWWRTPSTGKARSWWTTSLGEKTEEKMNGFEKSRCWFWCAEAIHRSTKSDFTVKWMTWHKEGKRPVVHITKKKKETKWWRSKTLLEHKEIINAERWTREWGDEFTGCTPTKESSKGHPAYACCQHTEAKEVQQKQWVQCKDQKQGGTQRER